MQEAPIKNFCGLPQKFFQVVSAVTDARRNFCSFEAVELRLPVHREGTHVLYACHRKLTPQGDLLFMKEFAFKDGVVAQRGCVVFNEVCC